MLKLQWLQIHKFRSVKPGTRLNFGPSFNVLLGQNGTGKTTLLNLVAAVVSSDFKAFRDEEFELEYELAAGAGRIQASVRNTRSPSVRTSLHEPFGPGSMFLSKGLETNVFTAEVRGVEPDGSSIFFISFDGSRIAVGPGRNGKKFVTELDAQNVRDHLWVALFMGIEHWATASYDEATAQSVLWSFDEFWTENRLIRFDESLGFFERLKETRFSLIRSKNGAIQVSSLDAPEELKKQLASLSQKQVGSERYVFTAEHVPFLHEVTRLLGFKSAEASAELQQASRHTDDEKFEYGNLRFLFDRPSGSRISEHHLSYGQKRMLAFMYYLATARSVVIADELVNGLHHSWIRACIEALGERQVFLTSQNPLLLDYLTFDSADQVRSTFVLSRWSEGEDGGQMLWENMSQEAAEDFFASYKVGFQQVGELLQAKGLW
jgi:energy-coupling factor transporter ATP-binding protein EcfA2